ncbi:hypothetical protein [Xanthocytophaga agilis]|uniref:Uncharacterized protein n=1 Tax=Xanthocytophaga agilis TaxID=3048010 RepID=A0AAE3RCA9_9BACT|nr:hypothetical protein [Xanthocytophaga agilis]MDJ1505797.1 hypothetical protein [Xanthocytophaga agilis]
MAGIAPDIKTQALSESLYTCRRQVQKKENPWTFANNVSFQPSPLLVNASPSTGYRLSEK